jgi:hypothetical protein
MPVDEKFLTDFAWKVMARGWHCRLPSSPPVGGLGLGDGLDMEGTADLLLNPAFWTYVESKTGLKLALPDAVKRHFDPLMKCLYEVAAFLRAKENEDINEYIKKDHEGWEFAVKADFFKGSYPAWTALDETARAAILDKLAPAILTNGEAT